ncbi:MAG: hypothetical protein IJC97_01775 [Oscillospiraceae bacterium]|nr:hypothetical protein [Oscillospiraceae bacterium]
MAKIVKRIKEKIHSTLNLEQFSNNFLKFSNVHFGNLVGTSLINTFVNTLFYRLGGGIKDVLLFNLIVFAITPFAKISAVFFLKKRNFTQNFIVSFLAYIIVYVLFFALLLFKSVILTIVVAMIFAVGNGFYKIAYSLSLTQYIGNDRRSRAMNLIGICSGFVTVIIPIFFGQIISLFKGFIGYGILIGFSGAVLLKALFSTKELKKIAETTQYPQFKKAILITFNSKAWLLGSLGELCRGVREGLIGFLPAIILFEIVQKESLVSVSILLTGLLTMVANKIYGDILERFKVSKKLLMQISLHVLVLGTIMLFFKLNIITIIIWTLLNAFLQVYITNPTLSIFYALISGSEGNSSLKPELFVVRSFFSALGRCFGIMLLFSILSYSKRYSIILLVVTGIQYLTLYFCSRAEAAVKKEGNKII